MIPSVLNEIESRIERLRGLDLVFIVGMPRSGTTWLQRLMNQHPQIVSRGECHFVDILYNNLKKNFQGYNRKVRVQGGALAHLAEYGGHVDSLELNNREMKLMLGYAVATILSKWITGEGIRVVAEKTPDNILSINLLSEIFPQAKFVHVIRDGRDCAVSFWFFNLKMAGEGKVLSETFEVFVNRYLKQWSTTVNLARVLGRSLGERYTEIRFESLVSQPFDTLTSLYSFLCVDTHPALVNGCLDAENFGRLSGGRSPGQEDRKAFFRNGTTGDWRNHMDEDVRRRAWRVAGEQLTLMGYPRN